MILLKGLDLTLVWRCLKKVQMDVLFGHSGVILNLGCPHLVQYPLRLTLSTISLPHSLQYFSSRSMFIFLISNDNSIPIMSRNTYSIFLNIYSILASIELVAPASQAVPFIDQCDNTVDMLFQAGRNVVSNLITYQ